MTIILKGSSSGSANLDATTSNSSLTSNNINISGTVIANTLFGNGQNLTGVSAGLQKANTFTSPGTFTVPATTTRIKVTAVSGGPGGEGAYGARYKYCNPGFCGGVIHPGGAGGTGGTGGVTSFGNYVTVSSPVSISTTSTDPCRLPSATYVGGSYGLISNNRSPGSGVSNTDIIFAMKNGGIITSPDSDQPGTTEPTGSPLNTSFISGYGVSIKQINAASQSTPYPIYRDMRYSVFFPYTGYYTFKSGSTGTYIISIDGVTVIMEPGDRNTGVNLNYGREDTIFVSQGTRIVTVRSMQHNEIGLVPVATALTISKIVGGGQQAYVVYLKGPFPPTIPVVIGAGGGGGGGGGAATAPTTGVGCTPNPAYYGTAGSSGVLTNGGAGGPSPSGGIAGGAGGGGGGASGYSLGTGGAAGTKGTSAWGPTILAPVRKTGTLAAANGANGNATTLSLGGTGGQGDWAWSNTTCPVGAGTTPYVSGANWTATGGPGFGGGGGGGGFSGVLIVEYD